MAGFGGILGAWRRRRAVAGYARRLPGQLRRDYGSASSYTPAQVRASVNRAGLDSDYSCYAMAMYTTPIDFAADHAARGEACDYVAMRAEVSTLQFGGSDLPTVDALCGADAPAWDGGADQGSGAADWGGGADAGGSSDGSSGSSSQDV